jgi:hypothetical protein
MAGKATKTNLHRATLRACLRVLNTAETPGQARIPLARLLNVFDKLEVSLGQARTMVALGSATPRVALRVSTTRGACRAIHAQS